MGNPVYIEKVLLRACLRSRGNTNDDSYQSFKESLGITPEHIDESHERWSWDEVFMSMAFTISKRSPDSNTQHGCVIVDKKNHIVATGFNGWPPGAPDAIIPNTRKNGKKYMYVIHSEVNAILQSTQSDLSECRAYITGLPCNECLKVLIAKGIKEVIIGDTGHVKNENYSDLHHFLIENHGIQVKLFCGKVVDTENRRDMIHEDQQTNQERD